MSTKLERIAADLIASGFAQPQDQGVGDTIARLLETSPWLHHTFQAAIRTLLAADCGCERRQAWLNERFPYRR